MKRVKSPLLRQGIRCVHRSNNLCVCSISMAFVTRMIHIEPHGVGRDVLMKMPASKQLDDYSQSSDIASFERERSLSSVNVDIDLCKLYSDTWSRCYSEECKNTRSKNIESGVHLDLIPL